MKAWHKWLIALAACAPATFFLYPKEQLRSEVVLQQNTLLAEVGTVETAISVTGVIHPRKQVQVSTISPGTLAKIHVRSGDNVRAGDLLAELDATHQQATFTALLAKKRGLEARRSQSEAALSLSLAQQGRQQELLRQNATSLDALEKARATVEQARADLAMAVAALSEVEGQELVEKARLDSSRLQAPISGTILEILAVEGQVLGGEGKSTTILTMADLTELEIELHISEADIMHIKPGQPAQVSLSGAPHITFNTRVERIVPAPITVNGIKLYRALAFVSDIKDPIYPNLAVRASLTLSSEVGVIAVPKNSIHEDDKGKYVEVLSGSGVERRYVTIGLSNRNQTAIRKGLEPGARIVLPSLNSGAAS